MFLIVYAAEIILMNSGDTYSDYLEPGVSLENDCPEGILDISYKMVKQRQQYINFVDIVQLLHYPSNPNIIFALQKTGIFYTLFQEQQSDAFTIYDSISLNVDNIPGLTCSDITQAQADRYYGVCQSKTSLFISTVDCDQFIKCTSSLALLSQTFDCKDPQIITSWRASDPRYITIYCNTESDELLLYSPPKADGLGFKVRSLKISLLKVQKVSFFDELTLMILDYDQGLLVVRLKETETETTYELLLQQQFLSEEKYQTMSYSHEQFAIRFPPQGIVENDIRYSLVIVTNLYLNELVLPLDSDGFINRRLPLSDKIYLPTKSTIIHDYQSHFQMSYDELFYYLCIHNQNSQNECLRIQRHAKSGQTPLILLRNNLQKPIFLTYPVAYSTNNGETNLLVCQMSDKTRSQVNLIQNTIQRYYIKSISPNFEACLITLFKDNKQLDVIQVITEPFGMPNLITLTNFTNFDFPSTQQSIQARNLIRGPGPILNPKVDNPSIHILITKDIDVSAVHGVRFSLEDQQYDEYFSMSRYRKSFQDDGFRLTFLQNKQIDIMIQYGFSNSSNFTIEFVTADCSFGSQIRQIVGVAPYYLIFYWYEKNYSIIEIRRDSNYKFDITCKSLEFLINDIGYEAIVDLDYLNLFLNTDSGIYYSGLTDNLLRKINTSYKFRSLSFKFLKNNILVGSYQNKLYYIELLNPYDTDIIQTQIAEIELGIELSDSFLFQIIKIEQASPILIIIDEEIIIYNVENIENDVQFQSKLQTYGNAILKAQVVVSYNTIIVPIQNKDVYFIYDLTYFGSDRLVDVLQWTDIPLPIIVSDTENKQYEYCVQFYSGVIDCYHNLILRLELKASDPKNIENEFQLLLTAFSYFSTNQKYDLVINGSFSYQETLIQNVFKTKDSIAIYKTKMVSQLNIHKYFNGPVFFYSILSKNTELFEFTSFIREPQNNQVKIISKQNLIGTRVNRDYLINLGNKYISIIKIYETQYTNIQQEEYVTYEDINVVLKLNQQPPVEFCFEAFINPLQLSQLQRVHVITLVCRSMITKDQYINYMFFTILANTQQLSTQFIKNLFFINFDRQEYIYKALGSIRLAYFQMINYPIKLAPNYKFLTVIATVKENTKYNTKNLQEKDNIIEIFAGHFDQITQNYIKGYYLLELGAQIYQRDNLIINNFQMYCVKQCSTDGQMIDTHLEITFNDQYEFNIYKILIEINYSINSPPIARVLEKEQLNIKQKLIENQQADKFQFSYIDTFVTKQNDQYSANITTDSISFDVVYGNDQFTVEQIFKQYTECPSPSGSFSASYNQYFAVSCRNNSMYDEEQVQYIKLFIREKDDNYMQQISAIEAIQVNGDLQFLEINKNVNTDNIQMLILEKTLKNEFILRWFELQDQYEIKLKRGAPESIFELQLCARNLNKSPAQCQDLQISNIGYGQYIFQEILLFLLLLVLPLCLSVFCIIFSITRYKKERFRRIEEFGKYLGFQVKSNMNVQQSHRRASVY